MLIGEIRKRVLDGKYLLTNHARARMNERHVRMEDVEDLIMDGVIIEEYPDSKPCPAALILGPVAGCSCHAVVACCKEYLRIITVYWPEDDKWENYHLRKSN